MKTIKNDSNYQPLTSAEAEASRQFEASDRDGKAMFHPMVAAGQPESNCVPFFSKIGRFAITILEGHYFIGRGRWWRREEKGIKTPADNALERAWKAARAIHSELKREPDRNAYVIAVAWFREMQEDEDIRVEVCGRGARLFSARSTWRRGW